MFPLNQTQKKLFVVYGLVATCILGGIAYNHFTKIQDKPSACSDGTACTVEETEDGTSAMLSLSVEECLQHFQAGDKGVYYFGFTDCPWCQEVRPILEEMAKTSSVPVYYIQTRDDNHVLQYTDQQKQELQTYIGEYMEDNEEGIRTLYVPLVVKMQGGIIEDGHCGTVDSHDAHERTMTEEESAQVRDIYNRIFDFS